ncbi:MAG: helix-turn-helix transcriptional regulator [Clostridia bacterium]|nr:helix-turn-helix transcriptional regulator [Clostridia bacterium]
MNNLNSVTVTEITDIFTVFSPKGRRAAINNRYCYGLSFCRDGQITYTHNGKQYISDKNHAVILPQGQSYTLSGDKTGSFPVIDFKCTELLCDTIAVLPVENAESYIKDYEQMNALSFFEGNRLKILGIFYGMLHSLHSCSNAGDILAPAVKYIENNYQDPSLNNATLAQQCALSEIYFRQLFTKKYKSGPKQFIIDIRINKAKQLLSEGFFRISVIADKCGFSNPYHFCRTFKQKTGITPTEYMKQNIICKI